MPNYILNIRTKVEVLQMNCSKNIRSVFYDIYRTREVDLLKIAGKSVVIRIRKNKVI